MEALHHCTCVYNRRLLESAISSHLSVVKLFIYFAMIYQSILD